STKPEPEKPPEPAKPTECKLKLWGVSVHSDGSSRCIIEDASAHKQEVYKIGDKAPGCGTVKTVEWDRVILDRDGREEILELANRSAGPGVPGPARPVAGVQPASTNAHIQQVGENQYNVDKSEVDNAMDNMNQLFTQIRAVPHFDGGKSIG